MNPKYKNTFQCMRCNERFDTVEQLKNHFKDCEGDDCTYDAFKSDIITWGCE